MSADIEELKYVVDEQNIPYLPLGENYRLRLELEDLDDRFMEIARTELRETKEIKEKAVEKLKQLIKEEPGLTFPTDEDEHLIKFLRPFKFYPNSAFKVMKNFYAFKAKYPEYGSNLSPIPLRHVFDAEVFEFLPTRNASGSRIMIVNANSKWNPKEVSLTDLYRAIMLAIEIGMIEPKTQVGGVDVIFNLKGLSLTHVLQFTPQTAKLIVDWVQTCAPVRLKGLHMVNQPFVFNIAWAIFKPLLGQKLRERIFFHGSNRKSLTEKISEEALPKYLGGTATFKEFPGSIFADMLCYSEDKFVVVNEVGFLKDPPKNEIFETSKEIAIEGA